MKQSKEYIQEILNRFDKGQTTEAEEDTLKQFFCSAEDIPEEWEAYRELFCGFTTDAFDFSQEEIDAMFTPAPKSQRQIWAWLAAACVIGIVALYLTPPKSTEDGVSDSQSLVARTEQTSQSKTDITLSTQGQNTKRAETKASVQVEAPIRQRTVQPKATDDTYTPAVEEEDSVQMSEDTKIELLMASLTEDIPTIEEIDIEDEIRLLRQRGERLMSMYETRY